MTLDYTIECERCGTLIPRGVFVKNARMNWSRDSVLIRTEVSKFLISGMKRAVCICMTEFIKEENKGKMDQSLLIHFYLYLYF